jgi:hypothetical protein
MTGAGHLIGYPLGTFNVGAVSGRIFGNADKQQFKAMKSHRRLCSPSLRPSSVIVKASSPQKEVNNLSHAYPFPHLAGNRSSLEHRLTFSFAELPLPFSCWSQQPPRFHNGHQGLVNHTRRLCVTCCTRPLRFSVSLPWVRKLFVPARKPKNTFRP